jgi:hypothetical protein
MSLRLHPRLPIIALILAFTAVPLDLRLGPGRALNLFAFGIQDVVLNILGYIPVGLVLAPFRATSMFLASLAISGSAELSQIFSVGRSPSLIDVGTNVLGATIGWYVARHLNLSARAIPVRRRAAAVAAVLALSYIAFGARFVPRDLEDSATAALTSIEGWGPTVNARGRTDPGTLEAAWRFDNSTPAKVIDASGNQLDGAFKNGAKVAAGHSGDVLTLRGANQYVDMGDPVALRLVGSMTLSAWIKVNAFSNIDGAIVARRERFGYQLDTTVYRRRSTGLQTVGFRLTNASGRLMARFGKTPVDENRWHHVAGVYDAEARTLNVFLDGRLDSGCQIGEVTSRQLPSQSHVFVGRSGRRDGYWFNGDLDDVRIYSRALTPLEIQTLVHETDRGRSLFASSHHARLESAWDASACAPSPRDTRVSGFFVMLGLVTAVACAGLWPAAGFRLPAIAASLLAGLLVLLSVPDAFPDYYRALIPLLVLAGGVVAVASMRSADREDTPSKLESR